MIYFRRKSPFTVAVALDEDRKAFGELYWDDSDSLGNSFCSIFLIKWLSKVIEGFF